MATFDVWAPAARRVEVEVAGRRLTAEPVGRRGWHRAVAPWAEPGADYAFVLDGGGPWPDPRSPWQPHGLGGPSRLLDHASFPWTDQGWRGIHLPSAVLYEVHVGAFTPEGTFDAAIAKLDHLLDVGVDVVELMPVAEFPGSRGWGYDSASLYAPHRAYGGPDGLKRLVDACHARGLGVVLDVVYNHVGPGGEHLARFGPYFAQDRTTPWGPAFNLDGPGSDEVRAFLVDNALMWLRDYHCDGVRVDAAHAMVDTSPTHLLEELTARVEELGAQLGRHLVVMAESDLNDPRVVRPREVGGYGVHAQWSDDFHHALHAVLSGERGGVYAEYGRMSDLAVAFRQAFVYAGRYSPRHGRTYGRLDPTLPGQRFLAYLQNHDQVGNRAAGERSAALMSTARLKVGAALVLTAPFVPLLFMGEEWGARTPFQYFTDHPDPELGRAVREGRLREFSSAGWRDEDVPDPQDPGTFAASKLRWQEPATEPHREILDWHRRLVRLRRHVPVLTDGRLDRVRTAHDDDRRWLVVERAPITTACNLGPAPVRLPARGELALASDPAVSAADDTVELPPDAVAILSAEP